MITRKNVYRLRGERLRWEVAGRPVAIYAEEFLTEDSERLDPETIKLKMELVGRIPCDASFETCNLDELKQAIGELQNFIKQNTQAPPWIRDTLQKFEAESARVEAELKAQEEADARAEEIADLKAIRAVVEKLGKPQKSITVPDEIPPDYSDPVVTRIRNSGDKCPKKLTDLYLHSLKYKAWTGPDVGKLIGETSDAIRNALLRMRRKAADLKKKEDEMEG